MVLLEIFRREIANFIFKVWTALYSKRPTTGLVKTWAYYIYSVYEILNAS